MALLSWLESPRADRGLRLIDRDGDGVAFHSYADLADRARRSAAALRAAGVGAGDVVVIARPTSMEFVADFFGAALLGATPSPVAPPEAFRGADRYLGHLGRILRLVDARALSTTPEVATLVRAVVPAASCRVVTETAGYADRFEAPVAPPRYGVIQFSSGSTAAPRAVRVSLAALQHNVSAIHRRLDTGSLRTVTASWLPLHHDMGLIGQFLVPVDAAWDFTLMPPELFLRRPERWIRCFSAGGATITAVPTFGLSHVARRVRPAALDGLDLREWNTIIVGAERVNPAVVRDFLQLLRPFGLDPGSVMPAYGLAEASLAVTIAPRGTGTETVVADKAALSPGRGVLGDPSGRETVELVACGELLDEVEVRILDEDGRPVADGVLGEIEVAGPSLADGYVLDDGSQVEFRGRLRTGDAGFVVDGRLFVVGRTGDCVKRHGRWFFAEDAEQVAVQASGEPALTVVLTGAVEGDETVVVALAGAAAARAAEVGRAVLRQCEDLRVLVLAVRSTSILRTSSGKPRRREMWSELMGEDTKAEAVWESWPVGARR